VSFRTTCMDLRYRSAQPASPEYTSGEPLLRRWREILISTELHST